MRETLPNYKHRIHGGQAETKHQSKIRNDKYAVSIYEKRLLIDKHNEQRELARTIGEGWDE